MAAKKKVGRPKKAKYTATLIIGVSKFVGKGDSVLSAIENIKMQGNAKQKGILTISNGNDTKDRVLTPFVVNRITNPIPLIRQIATKQASLLFDL